MLGLLFSHSLLLLCLQTWHKLAFLSSAGGRMGVCFPPVPQTACPHDTGKASLLPWVAGTFLQPPHQTVANQLPQAEESSRLLVAQRLCFMLSSVAGPQPFYLSLGKWSLWLDRCTEQGHRKEMGHEGVAGDSDIWWDTVWSHCQQQNVWQPLGTDLYYKYSVFPCNVKLESKAST